MKILLSSKFLCAFTLAMCLGVIGCNIFNPTGNVNVNNKDAKALTYEGYIKFRDNEYSEAEIYFNKAIAADSSCSEAWLGLMKSVLNRKLNTNSETNVFSLLQYVNANRDSKVPFSDMHDTLAEALQVAVDSVSIIANQFIELEKQGKTDMVITYKYISEGYLVLQMMKTMLIMRNTTKNIDGCNLDGNGECNMGTVLNSLKDNTKETVEAFHEVFNTCEENPESMSTLFDSHLQGYDYVSKDTKEDMIGSMCGALAKETEDSGDEEQQTKTLNIIISQFGYSDVSDDDGDGCVDEELYDGEDNDGDGEIDEDVRDMANGIQYNEKLILQNAMKSGININSLRIIDSATPNEKYQNIDIDMNDTLGNLDTDEWTFVYLDYNERVRNSNHRLVFANKLIFNPKQLPFDEYNAIKKEVAKDINPESLQYDLEYRIQNIGGCWPNYNEAEFMQWIVRRNKK